MLWQAVSAIADDVSASGIAGSIRGKKQIYTLELMRFALSARRASATAHAIHTPSNLPHRDLILPDALGLRGHEIRYLGSHVTRGDTVGPREPYPLDG